MSAEQKLVSVADLAAALEVSERQVQLLVREGMPKAKHGQYDFNHCVFWYMKRLIKHQRDMDEVAKRTAIDEGRLAAAKADLAELDLKQKNGGLVPLDLYRQRMSAQIVAARQHLLGLPGRIAPQLEGENRAVIKQRLHGAVCDVLGNLAKGEEVKNAADGAGNQQAGSGPAGAGSRAKRSGRRNGRNVGTATKPADKRVGRKVRGAAKGADQ